MLGKGALLKIIVTMVLTIGAGFFILPKLKSMMIGQSIREEGPKSHYKKAGTPTIGGVIFLSGWLVSIIIFKAFDRETGFILLSTLLFGLVGFLDDYIKVVKKRNLGLTAKQKIAGQLLASFIIIGLYILIKGPNFPLILPFTQRKVWEIGYFGIPLYIFVIVGTVNAVNLTDGLDGLSSGVTVFCLLFFALATQLLGIENVTAPTVLLIGALIGFLYFNSYPAKVFMGDTGSLALGGAIASISMITGLTLFLPIAGAIFIIETLSVMIQVFSFKVFGKRVFRMSPLHHHFEQLGWKETKVVKMFYVWGLVLLVIAYLGLN